MLKLLIENTLVKVVGMEKEYKILGNYIRLVDERNRDLAVTKLLGVSISKKFIPSIANIVGTDLSNYKIVRTGQFAYGPVTSRNGEKISIAYLDEEDCIISSSYTVFEVENKEELDPEYLMLWFSRPEFDRYARYKSHGSVREIFDWNELCMVELPVPDIEKQRKIVKAYKTITDRIALKQKINDNLEAQAEAIYNEMIANNSTNGTMSTLGEISTIKTGKLNSEAAVINGIYPFFTCSKEQLKISTYSYDCECVLVAGNGDLNVKYYNGKFDAYQRTYIIEDNSGGKLYMPYLYYFMEGYIEELRRQAIGGVIKYIKLRNITDALIKLPPIYEQKSIVDILGKIKNILNIRKNEIDNLDNLIKARFVEMFGSIHDGRYDMKTLPEIVNDDKNSIKRGPFGGALKKDDFVEDGYLVYEQRHAIHNDFEYAKYYITQGKYEDMIGFKVIPGDLIISCSGVTLGRIAEVPEGAKEGIINQALLKLSLNPEVMLNTFFIQQFRGEEIQEILFGFSRGSGIPNMPSMSEVKAVKFICPPLELQKQYCDFVNQVDKSKLSVLLLWKNHGYYLVI